MSRVVGWVHVGQGWLPRLPYAEGFGLFSSKSAKLNLLQIKRLVLLPIAKVPKSVIRGKRKKKQATYCPGILKVRCHFMNG